MSNKWDVIKTNKGIVIRGDDVTILIDPQGIPEDAIDIDFVILTSRDNYNEKVVEEVLSQSGAALITPFNVRRNIMKKYYVDIVDQIKGLTDDVWVYARNRELALFLYDEGGPLVVTNSIPNDEIDELSNAVYGLKTSKIIRGKTK
ncbi:hypothetical protein EYM_04485 [Ignicoccus islandicus DSM 13165]|uniref:Uncharacterized protein n=1 Tax=Ignicoccus islandicus DSM 13165 TaxID=940295 RepID=A0A0U3FQ95_9CREN|nr:hypothetical protein [Ignicoccus islandicus]ALU12495.1 hypothetical protein EYM_04485 [Ignicoccus islandicus DSM 13165]